MTVLPLHITTPDRSADAVAARSRIVAQVRASQARQGLHPTAFDLDLEDRWVSGEISSDQRRAELFARHSRL